MRAVSQKVAIVTDSSCCLPAEVASQHGIEIVPFEMAFEGRTYRDGVDDPDDFYRMLRKAERLPTTSAPSPGLFLQAFAEARERAESILCITLPDGLSSLHNSSLQAVMLAEEQMPGVRVDTMGAGAVASGQGLLVLEAARAAARGLDLDAIINMLKEMAPRVHFFAALDTLDYLAKGGHVPKVAAWLGGVVGIRPILTASNGDIKRIAQARSRKGAVDKMLSLMRARIPLDKPVQVCVMHADAIDEAEAFRNVIEERFECREMLMTPFTPVMGVHSGPGVLGVAFRVL